MYKRMSIRIVTDLSEDLNFIAKKRGLSVNALISEMAWDFVECWKSKNEERYCTIDKTSDSSNSLELGRAGKI